MRTSNMTSFAIDRSLGTPASVDETRLFLRELLDAWILSYHSIGMSSILFGGGGGGCLLCVVCCVAYLFIYEMGLN